MDGDAIAQFDVGLSDSGDGLLAGQDAHIFSVLDESVILAAGKVGEGLSGDDVGIIEKRLGERGDVGDDLGRVDSLKHVVRKQSSNGNRVILLLDGLALRNVPGYGCESIVCRRDNGDVRRSSKRVRKTRYETDKFK